MSARAPRPVPRALGWALVVTGLAINELTLEWIFVPDEELGAPALRAAVVLFQLSALALGVFVLRRRPRSRIPWHGLALGLASGLVAWFVCFAIIDTWFPGALGSTGIRYFEMRDRYVPDSTLVMVPRRPRDTLETVFVGDMYESADGIPAVERTYRVTRNELGFRMNLGEPPYELVVIGDSFVDFSTSDSTTISEELRRATGLSSFNLGRGWYGPFQYVELLRRYGLPLRPKVAVFTFFEGNDIRDIHAYMEWKAEEGKYSNFSVIHHSFPERFFIATADVLSALGRWGRRWTGADEDHPGWALGAVGVDEGTTWMKFGYWPEDTSTEEHLRRGEWEVLASLLGEFVGLCRRHDIVPLVVFVPAKVSVYGERVVDARGRLEEYLVAHADSAWPPSHYAEAVRRLTRDLEVGFVDLGSVYRARSERFPLLYHPFDTHWTRAGRRIAADVIADTLADMEVAEPASEVDSVTPPVVSRSDR